MKTFLGMPQGSNDLNSSLMSQIAELRNAIASKQGNVTVVHSGDGNKGSIGMVSLACIGVAATGGIILIKYYNLGITDLAWVTTKTFTTSISSLQTYVVS